MANTFRVIQMVSQTLLTLLVNNLIFAAGADRRWEDDFGKQGRKIGDFLDIRRVPRYALHEGPAYVGQDYVEETVRLFINKQWHADVDFTSVEMTLFMDDWVNRVAKPEAARLANQVDQDGLNLYWQAYNSVLLEDNKHWFNFAQAAALLDMEGVPRDDQRAVCIHPFEQPYILDETKGLFQQSTEIGRQYTEGLMGKTLSAKWSIDQNVATHTVGAWGGAPAVGAANQTGTTLATTGWPNSTAVAKRGDVFTLGNPTTPAAGDVLAVNPQSLLPTGKLRQFSVQADVTSSGTGAATLSIYPPMIAPPDPRATINMLPPAGKTLTVLGTPGQNYTQSLMYHLHGVTLANVRMFMPFGGEASTASDDQVKLAIRVWRDSSIQADQHLSRADVLYGWLYQMPEMFCRIWGPTA